MTDVTMPAHKCPVFHSDRFNPFDQVQKRDPYPFLAEVRAEAPVFYSSVLDAYVVTRHADVLAVLREPVLFSAAHSQARGAATLCPEAAALLGPVMPVPSVVFNDPPSHTRIRSLANRGFLPRRIATWAEPVSALANELVDGFVDDGETDIVANFAMPFPRLTIAEVVGVPRADADQFGRWAEGWAAVVFEQLPEEEQIRAARDAVRLSEYCTAMVEERRRHPREDLLSDMVHAREDGQPALSTAELVSILTMLLIAGHMTTTDLIGNSLLSLFRHPDQLDALQRNPALAPKIVEEVLRYESPVPGMMRMASADTEVGGVAISAGSFLYILFHSSNRDEAVFPRPDSFDPDRDNLADHLALGRGAHFCLGAPLARLEGKIALETLVRRLPGLRQVPDQQFDYILNLTFRGPLSLQVAWDATTRSGGRTTRP